jgi:hypothetical protein
MHYVRARELALTRHSRWTSPEALLGPMPMADPRAIAFAGTRHVLATAAAGLFILAVLSACDVAEMWLQARREKC